MRWLRRNRKRKAGRMKVWWAVFVPRVWWNRANRAINRSCPECGVRWGDCGYWDCKR